MFRGRMMITPLHPEFPPREVWGAWLFRPDTGCWYCAGQSYPEDMCEVLEVV